MASNACLYLVPSDEKNWVLDRGRSHGFGVVREDDAGCGHLPYSGSKVKVSLSDTELVTPAGICTVCETSRPWNRDIACDILILKQSLLFMFFCHLLNNLTPVLDYLVLNPLQAV